MTKIAPLLVALVMTVPTLVFFPAAEAQETVPIAPGVEWVAQAVSQNLHLRYPNIRPSDRPNCNSPGLSPVPASPTDPGDTTRECRYLTVGSDGSATTISFSISLAHGFNITGNRSLEYFHAGSVPAGVTMNVRLLAGTTLVASGAFRNDDGDSSLSTRLDFERQDARYEFRPGDTLTVQIRSEQDVDNGVPVPTTPTFTIRDHGPLGARLTITAVDALKAATWTQDEKGVIRSLFRPLDRNATLPETPRVVGHFAVQSAFGFDDARRGGDPRFTIKRGTEVVQIGPDRLPYLDGALSESLSDASSGRAVWTFPAGHFDYRGYVGGEYKIEVSKTHLHGAGYRGKGVEHAFFISTQSVSLLPYDDQDSATFPSPLENLAHDVRPGATTTYLLSIKNTGNVNDTFRLESTFVSGTPTTGWSAVIGGPNVLGNTVQLAPGEEKLVTYTVTAPAGATAGSNAIHQLRALSTVDPGAAAQSVTMVSTVTNEVRDAVDIIIKRAEEKIEPQVPTTHTVYVWNRGTRTSNYTLELQETPKIGWQADLLLGNLPVKQLLLSNVKPGDVARVDLRATGPISDLDSSYTVKLLATDTRAGDIAREKSLTFILEPTSAVRIQVLDRIGNTPHRAEVTNQFGTNPSDGSEVNDPRCSSATTRNQGIACFKDGVDGAWYRVWVTNTGKRADQFRLTVDSTSWAQASNCDSVFTPHEFGGDGFRFYFRDAKGEFTPRDIVRLEPGDTGELYLWRAADRLGDPCSDADREIDFYKLVVQARGVGTGAVARQAVEIIAEDRTDNDRTSALLLEGVSRDREYSINSPLVDVSNLNLKTIVGGVEVGGEPKVFRVRVTNGAAWSDYQVGSATFSPDITFTLAGVDEDGGWNVTMRPVRPGVDERDNPWVKAFDLGNQRNGRREAWVDDEIEIRVRSPSAQNGTALAGEQDQFTLRAEMERTPGKSVVSSLEFKAVITKFANVTVAPDKTSILAHAGKPGAFLLYIQNNGSFEAPVKVRASMNREVTPDADGWHVEPAEQQFTLAAFKNRSLALLVTPPASIGEGARGEVNVTVEFARDPLAPTKTENETKRLTVEVTRPGSLQLVAASRDTTAAPGGFANFTMTLRNTGGVAVPFQVTGTPIPNWTATLSPVEGGLQAGETRTLVYVLEIPSDVVEGSRFSSIVRVEEVGNEGNFDIVPVTVNILGGKPITSLSAPVLQKTIDRNRFQTWEVNVKNVGSAAGTIPLEVRAGDERWTAWVTDHRGENISSIRLGPNELRSVNVTVGAPFAVPENTVVPVELTAYAPDFTQSSKIVLRAQIHDYGVDIEASPATIVAFAGAPGEFVLRLRNTGNDNDTLNVSAQLVGQADWAVELSDDRVRLEPGQSTEVRATVRWASANPTSLPAPRTYSFKFFAGTVGGAAVNHTKNDTVTVQMDVLNYRALDVDGDGQLEIAVDQNKRSSDGFETFREIRSEGLQSTVIAVGHLGGKARFFLDLPRDGPYDGVADVWFDPEDVYRFEIRQAHVVDLDGDATPDYLLDTDRDREIDMAYDTVTGTYWSVTEVKVFGDDRVQYLVDTTDDGRPDRFYDPEAGLVTRTQRVQQDGADMIGIDTTNDGKVNKYFDTKTGSVSDAKVANLSDFAMEYWYFFLGFAVLLVFSIALLVRRMRG